MQARVNQSCSQSWDETGIAFGEHPGARRSAAGPVQVRGVHQPDPARLPGRCAGPGGAGRGAPPPARSASLRRLERCVWAFTRRVAGVPEPRPALRAAQGGRAPRAWALATSRSTVCLLMYSCTSTHTPLSFGNNFIFFTEREKERVLARIQVAHAAAVPPAHRLNVTSNARTVEASSPVPPSRYYRARVASRGRGRSRVACAFFALRSRNDNLETDRQNNGLHDTYTLSVCLSLSLLVLLLGWHPTVSTR
jgi:hypothetical protein